MTMVGADADRLEAAAAHMQKAADELDAHSAALGHQLGGLSWLGQLAGAFANLWSSHHKPQLGSTAHFIREAADRLAANAKQQRDASAVSGASLGGQAAPARPPVAAVTSPSAAPAATTPGGELPGTHRTWQQVQQDYETKYSQYGLYSDGAPGNENEYQCVSWAWFRMRELGFEGAQVSAHGKNVAGALGGSTSTVPVAGAVMSYDRYNDQYGHVSIVEEVIHGADGRLSVRLSEMNVGGDGIAGHANEYRSDRVITQNADGTWSCWGANIPITVANPTYKR
jgi:surface antigen